MHKNIIGILRGVKPDEVLEVATAIYTSGITWIEVPLNSPNAFDSIELLVKELGSKMMIGAGTVLTPKDVLLLESIGADFVVSPNCNEAVIKQTKLSKMISCPGVLTATECFNALEFGADILKIFPANSIGSSGISALKAVLPDDKIYVVGGVNPSNMQEWKKAGASGFGIGTSLYKPNKPLADISKDAKNFVDAYNRLT